MEAIELTDYPFIPESDKKLKKKDQTIIWMSTLDFEQDTYVENLIADNTKEGDLILPILSMGLKRFENFKNSKGKDIVIKRDEKSETTYPGNIKPLTNDCLSKISNVQRSQLTLQIRFGKEISEKEAKN
jgi:hypothetical protein